MRGSRLILLGIGAAAAVTAMQLVTGQETPDAGEEVIAPLDARVRSFFESLSQGATQIGYDNLLRGSPLLIDRIKDLEKLKESTGQIPSRFGDYRSFERVDARRVGKNVVLLKYLYHCDDLPVAWHFTFYRPPPAELAVEDAEWRLVSLRFDTKLESLAESTRR